MIKLINSNTVVPGTDSIIAVHMDYPCPVGYIYYRPVMGMHVELLDCYVNPLLRRQGILTKMFQKMLIEHGAGVTFITQTGSEESTPWLKKIGFKQRADGWWLDPVKLGKVKRKQKL